MERPNILRLGCAGLGYAGRGEPVALPWAPVSPAFDKSFNDRYAFDLDKAKALLAASGLSAAETSNWKLLVNSADESAIVSRSRRKPANVPETNGFPVKKAPFFTDTAHQVVDGRVLPENWQ